MYGISYQFLYYIDSWNSQWQNSKQQTANINSAPNREGNKDIVYYNILLFKIDMAI